MKDDPILEWRWAKAKNSYLLSVFENRLKKIQARQRKGSLRALRKQIRKLEAEAAFLKLSKPDSA